jgi:hypothetical protein
MPGKCIIFLIKNHPIKTYWGEEVYLHVFLTSALNDGEWSTSRPGRFTPGIKTSRYLLTGGCMGHTAGLGGVARRKKIPTLAGNLTPVI